jgi:O-antigen ligase
MILIGSGVLTKRLQERFQTVFRPASEEHVLARLDAMAEGVRMFRQHPVTGIGLGQFGANFERYAGAQVYGVAVDPSFYRQANNDYLQYLATTGVVGFVALTILFGTFLLRAYRLIALTLDEQTRAVLIGCFLSTVAFAVTALSQDPLWDKTYGTLLFTDLALIWSVRGEGL